MNKINFSENIFFDEDIKKIKKELYQKNFYKKKYSIYFQLKFIEKFLNELSKLLGKKFKKYNFYIYSSNNVNELPHSVNINHSKKILIFISNETNYIPFNLEKYFFCIFKCYLPYEPKNSKIFSFPLNIISDVKRNKVIPINKRPIDIFFCGNLNSNRLNLYNALSSNSKIFSKITNKFFYSILVRTGLKQKFLSRNMNIAVNGNNYIKFTNGFNGEGGGLNYNEYFRLLNNSKVILCPRGYISPETFRHYEAIKSGSVVITEKLPKTYFYKNAPYIEINNWKDGIIKAEKLILNLVKLKNIQKRNNLYYKQIMSEKSVAKYAYKLIKSIEK